MEVKITIQDYIFWQPIHKAASGHILSQLQIAGGRLQEVSDGLIVYLHGSNELLYGFCSRQDY